MTSHYLIKWQNTGAKGSSDLLDGKLFSELKIGIDLHHMTIFADTSCVAAEFHIQPDGCDLLFCYGGRHSTINKARSIDRGDVRINVADFARTEWLGWRDDGDTEFKMLPVHICEIAAIEGDRVKRISSALKRKSKLTMLKRAYAIANGGLKCEVCAFDGLHGYGDASHCCFEVHHKRSLSKGKRNTKLDDLALICANCHNAIHGLGDISFIEFLERFRRPSLR